ncbi:MAG TPA: hypothetical protein VFZ83_11080 [Acidimicrobiia bacterium]|nr:hypothetical protein [Acidimicrobiia bacterium]
MTRITVLDPTAAPPAVDPDPGPDAGSLAGRRVGLRHDRAWRSWDHVMDDWAARLRAADAEVVTWCAGNRIGEEGERTAAELERFADDVDVVVVGLGN